MHAIKSLILVACILLPGVVLAQGVGMGTNELNALIKVLTGPVGKSVAVLCTIFGLWQWLVKGNAGAGILAIVGAALLVLMPAFFDRTKETVAPLVRDLTGTDDNCYLTGGRRTACGTNNR